MASKLKIFLSLIKKYNLSYSVLKYFPAWKSSQKNHGKLFLDKDEPWITYAAQEFLEKIIKPEFVVFEFGGGSSSFYLSKRVSKLFTVEHEKEWFLFLEKRKKELDLKSWEIFLAEPQKITDENSPSNPGDPSSFISADKFYSGNHFKKYAEQIKDFPDNYFDLVIVDGRARPSCIMQSLLKVKKNGYLMIDNMEREYYLAGTKNQLFDLFDAALDEFGPSPSNIEFTKTSIFKRK